MPDIARARYSSTSILGVFGLSTDIVVDMMRERRRCVQENDDLCELRVPSGGRVGVICLCMPKASDPNTSKQPLCVNDINRRRLCLNIVCVAGLLTTAENWVPQSCPFPFTYISLCLLGNERDLCHGSRSRVRDFVTLRALLGGATTPAFLITTHV